MGTIPLVEGHSAAEFSDLLQREYPWKEKPVGLSGIKVYLLWFDSMGAKCSSVLIETPDVRILVDPGASAMQPSYPLPEEIRRRLRQKALDVLQSAAKMADVLFISHYHHDHYANPQEYPNIYKGKRLWVKNPNCWINRSQGERGHRFLQALYELFGNHKPDFQEPPRDPYPDPLEDLPLARKKDFGDYQRRRESLLRKGKGWFQSVSSFWKSRRWIQPFCSDKLWVQFIDGEQFRIGRTQVRFTRPLFHGQEYDRVGWVIGLVVEYRGEKVLYSSDLQGPTLEDYAHWIIEENPQVLILDGPATYLFGYLINRINLRRAIDNACQILKALDAQVILYDHHLPRDHLYEERMGPLYRLTLQEHKPLMTAAEWFGVPTLIKQLKRQKRHKSGIGGKNH